LKSKKEIKRKKKKERKTCILFNHVQRIRYFPCGKRLLSHSFDGVMKIWDISSGLTWINTPYVQEDCGTACDVSPDGKSMISVCGTSIYVWDSELGECKIVLHSHKKEVFSHHT
jgi:WD40 repeat protein